MINCKEEAVRCMKVARTTRCAQKQIFNLLMAHQWRVTDGGAETYPAYMVAHHYTQKLGLRE